MTRVRRAAAAATVLALLPATGALADSAHPAAVARKCADKEYFGTKIDHYAVDIKATHVSCSAADLLFKHDLKLAGWHVSQTLAQSGTTEKAYRVKATRGTAVVTLVWTVLQAG